MSHRRTRWWLLYGLVPLSIAAFVWAHGLGLSERAEMVVQILILVITFGLMIAWLNANEIAFLDGADLTEPDALPVSVIEHPIALETDSAAPEKSTSPARSAAPDYRATPPVILGRVLD
jgi:hypothetical protein